MNVSPVGGYLGNPDERDAAGLGFPVAPPPPQPDHVQQSTAYGLDFGSGELVSYAPVPRAQDVRQP